VLDIKRIREDPDGVRTALARREGGLANAVGEILQLDEQWRAATSAAERARATQKERSQQFGRARAQGGEDPQLRAELQQLGAQVRQAGERASQARERLDELIMALPNLPDPSAADGPEDEVVREVGEPPRFDFDARDHLELAGTRIDTERAAKVSGARFAYLRGELVLLELALVRWAIERLRERGFEPVIPPVLVRERALFGTGFLPDTEQQIYRLADDELYLVGTSEVPLASLHDGEMLDQDSLPLRYAGFSSCFRREAGAAGKDTRGIFRVHQFDKVEMFSFVAPEDSAAEHERILGIEEELLGELGLAYRVVNIAVGELGASAAKKYDCEAWLPSQGRYRELTSCSNTTDFQARRLDIRVRRAGRSRGPGGPDGSGGSDGPVGPGGSGATFTPHTLNGTAVAVGRTIVALLENGQHEDGSVALPACLAAYGAPVQLEPAASI
jgi:seryl-tRNA synthetase